jgi:ubiquinone/menaquinone biosynthesis C-methylase UbiE
MKTSSDDEVRELYEGNADHYAKMMEREIEFPVYAALFERLSESIAEIDGALLDTSCGTGHMLARYHEHFDTTRPLIGVDLSPHMVAIARALLGARAELLLGDMCRLDGVDNSSAAAVLSYFALHHLSADDAQLALQEWHRVLRPGGTLAIATWEGEGAIDYGEDSDLVALRYTSDKVTRWAEEAGFRVTRCVVEPVEEFPMAAVYLDATKNSCA